MENSARNDDSAHTRGSTVEIPIAAEANVSLKNETHEHRAHERVKLFVVETKCFRCFWIVDLNTVKSDENLTEIWNKCVYVNMEIWASKRFRPIRVCARPFILFPFVRCASQLKFSCKVFSIKYSTNSKASFSSSTSISSCLLFFSRV